MALNRCVAIEAPASTAADSSSGLAAVWPTDTTTPAECSNSVAAIAPGNSGARVTNRSEASCRHAAVVAAVGSTSRSASCAPRNSGDRAGPSRWSPSGTAPTQPSGGPEASSSSAARASSIDAEIKVARKAVTPWAARPAPTSQMPSGSVVKWQPKPPLTCRSTKPGSTDSPDPSTTSTPSPGGSATASRPPPSMVSAQGRPRASSAPSTRRPRPDVATSRTLPLAVRGLDTGVAHPRRPRAPGRGRDVPSAPAPGFRARAAHR